MTTKNTSKIPKYKCFDLYIISQLLGNEYVFSNTHTKKISRTNNWLRQEDPRRAVCPEDPDKHNNPGIMFSSSFFDLQLFSQSAKKYDFVGVIEEAAFLGCLCLCLACTDIVIHILFIKALRVVAVLFEIVLEDSRSREDS